MASAFGTALDSSCKNVKLGQPSVFSCAQTVTPKMPSISLSCCSCASLPLNSRRILAISSCLPQSSRCDRHCHLPLLSCAITAVPITVSSTSCKLRLCDPDHLLLSKYSRGLTASSVLSRVVYRGCCEPSAVVLHPWCQNQSHHLPKTHMSAIATCVSC